MIAFVATFGFWLSFAFAVRLAVVVVSVAAVIVSWGSLFALAIVAIFAASIFVAAVVFAARFVTALIAAAVIAELCIEQAVDEQCHNHKGSKGEGVAGPNAGKQFGDKVSQQKGAGQGDDKSSHSYLRSINGGRECTGIAPFSEGI